jgi:hypothetical protein
MHQGTMVVCDTTYTLRGYESWSYLRKKNSSAGWYVITQWKLRRDATNAICFQVITLYQLRPWRMDFGFFWSEVRIPLIFTIQSYLPTFIVCFVRYFKMLSVAKECTRWLVFKLKIKSRKERWISTHAHMLEHTIRTYLKHYIKIGLKS